MIIFTRHAKQRMVRRNISPEKVINTIKYPDLSVKKNNRIFFRKFEYLFEVVCVEEKVLKVLTVYWV